MTEETDKKEIKDFQPTSVSLVDRCPYCGSHDWENPGTLPVTGEVCNHPTQLAMRGHTCRRTH